jgi:hypothetical protein
LADHRLQQRIRPPSQALAGIISALQKRIADFEAQDVLAASTDYPP